ncbi:MAG: class C sortase [Tissierellia bacterium]|nr:class C sortase [Tissierellia bacterium]
MKNKRRIGRQIGISIILIAIIVFLFPFYKSKYIEYKSSIYTEELKEKVIDMRDDEKIKIKEEAKKYNLNINSAENLKDPFDENNQKNVDPFIDIGENEAVGTIDIDKINLHMPIFLGASDENLAKGAAVIEGTSLPIGGRGTRSVIAGHRGYYSAPEFIHINLLEENDIIKLNILGDEMTYIVKDQELIYPYDTGSLGIIENKDMITLLTCDPIPSFKYRLLVNAERSPDEIEAEKLENEIEVVKIEKNEKKDKDGKKEKEKIEIKEISKSEVDPVVIKREKLHKGIRIIGTIILVFVLYLWIKNLRDKK